MLARTSVRAVARASWRRKALARWPSRTHQLPQTANLLKPHPLWRRILSGLRCKAVWRAALGSGAQNLLVFARKLRSGRYNDRACEGRTAQPAVRTNRRDADL